MTEVLVCNPATMSKYLEDYSPTAHDVEVQQLISKTIDQKYNSTLAIRGGASLATVGHVLEACFAPGATRIDDDTTDTVSRDAEYYFKSRYMVAHNKHLYARLLWAVGMDTANLGYFAKKTVYFALGIQDRLKTDNGAVSHPGGVYWGFKGSLDGFEDNPNAFQRPTDPTLPRRGPPVRLVVTSDSFT
jgi:hypothetical protein